MSHNAFFGVSNYVTATVAIVIVVVVVVAVWWLRSRRK
jgi:sensor domain CHASE-containing protein